MKRNKILRYASLGTVVLAAYLGFAHMNDALSLPMPDGDAKSSMESGDEAGQRKSGNPRKYEMPAALKGVPERIIAHTGYTVSFNREHNNPNYVAWELTADEVKGTRPRADEFLPDPDVPAPHRVTTEDYKGSGYDRGHMVPAADMKWSSAAMRECFYMSNMCPQDGGLNSGPWKKLEEACRRWASREGSVYIVCGPIYNKGRKHKTIGRKHKVTVPDAFFKVVLSLKPGKEKAIGFCYENRSGKQPMPQAAMSVDKVEEMTGMDFFVNVDDRLEKRIETQCVFKDWQ